MAETENPVWLSVLDEKYRCTVIRDENAEDPAYSGRLQIREGEKLLLDEPVSLAFGAMFGPDIDDVRIWQNRACEFVDSL